MSRYNCDIVWGVRAESVEACVVRLQEYLRGLAELHPKFEKWCEKAWTRKKAERARVNINDEAQLKRILLKGRNRRDDTGEPILDLGFGVGLWNYGSGGDANVSIFCGGYNSRVKNNVLLHPPENFHMECSLDSIVAIFAHTIRCWEPESGSVHSHSATDWYLRRRDEQDIAIKEFVDWLCYIDRPAPALPLGCYSIPVEPRGEIIVLEKHPIAFEDEEHVQKVLAVCKALGYPTEPPEGGTS